MEHNRDCGTTGEVYGDSESLVFPLNVDKNSQKNSTLGNQYKGIAI